MEERNEAINSSNFESIKYSRLGGWLLFHLVAVGLGILISIVALINLGNTLSSVGGFITPEVRTLVSMTQIFAFISIALNVVYLYFGVSKKDNSVKVMKGILVVQGIFGIIGLISIPAYAQNATQFGAVLGSVIWWFYLSKSERVHVYYEQ